jgi:hypothetical protein
MTLAPFAVPLALGRPMLTTTRVARTAHPPTAELILR